MGLRLEELRPSLPDAWLGGCYAPFPFRGDASAGTILRELFLVGTAALQKFGFLGLRERKGGGAGGVPPPLLLCIRWPGGFPSDGPSFAYCAGGGCPRGSTPVRAGQRERDCGGKRFRVRLYGSFDLGCDERLAQCLTEEQVAEEEVLVADDAALACRLPSEEVVEAGVDGAEDLAQL